MKSSLYWFVAASILFGGMEIHAQEGGATPMQPSDTAGGHVSVETLTPAAILAQAKQASGGSAWDGVHTLHLRAESSAGGLIGFEDRWLDVRTGRYLVRSSRPPAGGALGFDGVSVWTQSVDGYGYIHGDQDAREGAANEAYRTCLAYWFPERANATLASVGATQDNGHTYDVIKITPEGGRPFDLWIDQATHLIDRFVEQQDEDVKIVRWLDYREAAGGIKMPHTIQIGDGEEKWDEVDTVQTVEINGGFAQDQFALPANPPPDFQFADGKTSTTVPLRLDNGEPLIDIKLNGQGPFETLVDSGGGYLIQPRVAERLQLRGLGASKSGGGGEGFVASGRATIDSVEIGDLQLTKQAYKILSFYDEKPEMALLGRQILQRFVVRLDFDQHTLTLTRPESFTYSGNGQVVPFHFQDNQPEVNGSIDGIAGVFAIDTGDNASLLLIAPFAKRHDFVERYKATIPYGGTAVGGKTHGVMARTGALALFGADGRPAVEVHDSVTRISQQKGGFDANRYVSGNVGIGVLSQFNLIFDYSHQQIIFEKNKHYGQKDVYNRTGLQLERNGAGWDVVNVIPGSPAAELGITPGESVVTIDGRDAGSVTPGERGPLFTREVGSKIVLVVRSKTQERTVTLSLRDLL